MASPFAIFRKHERLLMAIAGIMAMITFVFFDPFVPAGADGRGGAGPCRRRDRLRNPMRQTSACSAPGH